VSLERLRVSACFWQQFIPQVIIDKLCQKHMHWSLTFIRFTASDT
jgi:hypothetical protein